MPKKEIMKMDENNDFGWGEISVTEDIEESRIKVLNERKELTERVLQLEENLFAVREMILPLLKHLAKDPEKPMIKWPNRKEILEKQTKRFLELTDTE